MAKKQDNEDRLNTVSEVLSEIRDHSRSLRHHQQWLDELEDKLNTLTAQVNEIQTPKQGPGPAKPTVTNKAIIKLHKKINRINDDAKINSQLSGFVIGVIAFFSILMWGILWLWQ
jgi:hypothetical protein